MSNAAALQRRRQKLCTGFLISGHWMVWLVAVLILAGVVGGRLFGQGASLRAAAAQAVEAAMPLVSAGPPGAAPGGPGEGQRADIVLAAHYRTGATLARTALPCLHGRSSRTVALDLDWAGEAVAPGALLVHFARSPAKLLASAFRHARRGEDAWASPPHLAADLGAWMREGELGRAVRANESYSDFLRRAPLRIGLAAELARLRHGHASVSGRDPLDDLGRGHATCAASPAGCLEVCTEQFASAEGRAAAWRAVLGFMGVDAEVLAKDAELRGCLAVPDAGGPSARDVTRKHDHADVHDADPEEERAMARIIPTLLSGSAHQITDNICS